MDVALLAAKVEERLERFYREHPSALRPRVAVMGCVVNGPGEAKHADIAVAGGDGVFALFVRGQQVRVIPESEALDAIVSLVERWPA